MGNADFDNPYGDGKASLIIRDILIREIKYFTNYLTKFLKEFQHTQEEVL